tara:strand:- start:485 stop:2623 length:2139 start_codon:yes stop_codon:yes gene_type:complete
MNHFGSGKPQPAASDALFPGFPTLDVGRLYTVVKKRLWLAALVAMVFVGLAVAYVYLAPKVYESSAVIYVDPNNEGAVFDGLRGVKQASWETLDALKSMADGIRNGTVILRVVDRLELRNDPTFLKPRELAYSDSEIVEIVSRNVDASLRRGTRLIDVSVRDKSPERSRDMAAAFIDEFQGLVREQNGLSAESSRIRLEEEAANQLKRVLAAEDKRQQFRLAHAEIPLDEDNDFVSSKLADLDKALGNAESEAIMRRAEYEQYQEIKDSSIERAFEISELGEQDHIQKLLLARNQKKAEFFGVKKMYQPTHPTYMSFELDLEGLDEQVKVVAEGVGESIEKAYLRAKNLESQLLLTIQEQKKKLIEVDGVRKEFRTLTQSVNSASATYESLLDRVNDSDVAKGVDETVVRTFSAPLVPAKPIAPKKTLTVGIAGVFGSMCGLALVVGIGLIDRTLNSRKQVESTLGMTVLAEVPKAFGHEWDLRESLFVNRDPNSMVSESFRSLRTSLSAYRAKSVMITSASPGEGKSFCAANLALLQASMGYRTLLVDADFCKPRMAELFVDPMKDSPGDGEITTQNLCQETTFKNLYLISCGRFTSNTGEPMSEEVFSRMLQEANSSFDCIIIDTSPLNAVSDALTYAPHVEATVMVVKAGETDVEPARRAIHDLQRMRARLAGCILNCSSVTNSAQVAYVEGTVRSLPTQSPSLSQLGV